LKKGKETMTEFDQVIEAVKQQIQPAQRAQHLAGMLQRLFALTPDDVTLADLLAAWQLLGRSQSQDEPAAIVHRRDVCNRLSAIATPLTNEPGQLAAALKTWQAWQDAFQQSTDPRESAMVNILVREIAELQLAQG
jgi:hypothetical protein